LLASIVLEARIRSAKSFGGLLVNLQAGAGGVGAGQGRESSGKTPEQVMDAQRRNSLHRFFNYPSNLPKKQKKRFFPKNAKSFNTRVEFFLLSKNQ